jgi:hypothetical protein
VNFGDAITHPPPPANFNQETLPLACSPLLPLPLPLPAILSQLAEPVACGAECLLCTTDPRPSSLVQLVQCCSPAVLFGWGACVQIRFVFSSSLVPEGTTELGQDMGHHLRVHGDGVKDVAFAVSDVARCACVCVCVCVCACVRGCCACGCCACGCLGSTLGCPMCTSSGGQGTVCVIAQPHVDRLPVPVEASQQGLRGVWDAVACHHAHIVLKVPQCM